MLGVGQSCSVIEEVPEAQRGKVTCLKSLSIDGSPRDECWGSVSWSEWEGTVCHSSYFGTIPRVGKVTGLTW
jgi:hypothetical protein